MYCHYPAYLRKRTEEIAKQQLSKNNTQEEYFKEAGSHKDRLHQETEIFVSLIRLTLYSSITENFKPKIKAVVGKKLILSKEIILIQHLVLSKCLCSLLHPYVLSN